MGWVKNVRIEQGKTQHTMAKSAGISRAAYANIENGARTPSVKVAKALAEELGVEWTRFFDDRKEDEA